MASARKIPRDQIKENKVIPLFKDKICTKCLEKKDIDCFARDKYRKTGFSYKCKVCRNSDQLERAREWRKNNREKIKDKDIWYKRKYEFNITKEEYYKILLKQNNSCAICKKTHDSDSHKRMHIDHNHVSKKIRGLLCFTCNVGLGLFKDNITVIKNAIEYLETRGNYG